MPLLLPGQYPRSEKLIQATRDYDRGRITEKEVQDAFRIDREDLLDLQKGFSYKTSGFFGWQDLMRPFCHLIEGAKTGPLTRFLETNTFWRELQAPSSIKLNYSAINRYFDNSELITLPFLFTFKKFSVGISSQEIVSLLSNLALHLLSYDKNRALVFYEPCLQSNVDEDSKKLGEKLLEIIKNSSNNPIFITTTGRLTQEMIYLRNLKTDGIGIDFYSNSIDSIMPDFPKDKILLAGLINTASTLLESESSIKTFQKMMKDKIEHFVVIPNGPPEYLPRNIMDQKVRNMRNFLK